MQKPTPRAVDRLAQALLKESASDADIKAMELTAAQNRVLLGLYSLLTAASLFVVIYVDLSPWGGAAALAACVLFFLGVFETTSYLKSARTLLFRLDSARSQEPWEDSGRRADAVHGPLFNYDDPFVRQAFSNKGWLLRWGLVAIAVAAVIERWEYGWRALVVLGGLLVVMFLLEMLVETVGTALENYEASREEDTEG